MTAVVHVASPIYGYQHMKGKALNFTIKKSGTVELTGAIEQKSTSSTYFFSAHYGEFAYLGGKFKPAVCQTIQMYEWRNRGFVPRSVLVIPISSGTLLRMKNPYINPPEVHKQRLFAKGGFSKYNLQMDSQHKFDGTCCERILCLDNNNDNNNKSTNDYLSKSPPPKYNNHNNSKKSTIDYLSKSPLSNEVYYIQKKTKEWMSFDEDGKNIIFVEKKEDAKVFGIFHPFKDTELEENDTKENKEKENNDEEKEKAFDYNSNKYIYVAFDINKDNQDLEYVGYVKDFTKLTKEPKDADIYLLAEFDE